MVDVSDLIGIPYKEHGRDKSGMDCYGLVMEVAKRFGVNLPDFDYETHTDEFFNTNAIDCIKSGKPKKIHTLVEGALILFANSRGQMIHIGIYLGDGYIVHCNYQGVHLQKLTTLKQKMEIYVWQK